jgi:hypothetical protein
MSPFLKTVALGLGLACATTIPPLADAGFDGRWSVSATVDEGGCDGPYSYPIVIRDGIVDDARGSNVDASGRVGGDGRIVGSISSGLASVAVEGRLAASTGSGRWTLTGPIVCTGRWTATRSG